MRKTFSDKGFLFLLNVFSFQIKYNIILFNFSCSSHNAILCLQKTVNLVHLDLLKVFFGA